MSRWPSARARRVLGALLRLGWRVKQQSGSHRTLARDGWPDYDTGAGRGAAPRRALGVREQPGLDMSYNAVRARVEALAAG